MSTSIAIESVKTKPTANRDAFRDSIYEQIKKATGNNYGVNVQRAFIGYTGSLEAAVFLSQMIHWTPRATRPDGFVWKENAEWFEETGLKRTRLHSAAKVLEFKGILHMEKKMANGSPTWHYRLDRKAFASDFTKYLETAGNKNLRKSAGRVVGSEPQLATDSETALDIRIESRIENSLRKLIQDIPADRAEEASLVRLCGLVEEGTYAEEDIGGCARWILETFDMVAVTPTAIEKRLPTYRAKKKSGVLGKARYESSEQRNERIVRERNREEIIRGAAAFDEERAKVFGHTGRRVLE